MKSERLPWLDVAKGLLIISVLIYHVPFFAGQNHIKEFDWMFYTHAWFKYYFMPAFFVITGFCSSFEKINFYELFKNNFKSLIIPGFLVSSGTPIGSHLLHGNTYLLDYWTPIRDFFCTGGFWFLTSLFWGKIIYFVLFKSTKSLVIRGGVCFFLLLGGVVMHSLKITNFWFVQNTMCLCIFLWLGEVLSLYHVKILGKKFFFISCILYFSVVYSFLMFNVKLPFVTLHVAIDSIFYIPLFIVLSVSGSLMLLNFCKIVCSNIFLEYIGKRTLIIYIFHMYILLTILPHMEGRIPQGVCGNTMGILLVLCIILICLVIDFVLNTRYLKWFLGKF